MPIAAIRSVDRAEGTDLIDIEGRRYIDGVSSLPLAAKLASERVHEGFLGEHEEFRTFFHGHTYTGNPLACAAAIASLDVFSEEETLARLQPKLDLLGGLLEPIAAHPAVREPLRGFRRVGVLDG